MKLQLTALALGLGFAGFTFAAQYNYTSTDYTALAHASGTGNNHNSNGFKESFESGLASSSLESASEELEKYGTHFLIDATSSGGVLTTTNQTSWAQPADPTMILKTFSSTAHATSHEDADRDFAGKIRFRVDYELYVNSTGAEASVSFNAWANLYNPSDEFFPVIGTASFSEYLYAFEQGGALSKSGTWTSDWLSFSDSTQLQDLAVLATSFGYFLQTSSTATSDSANISLPGALNSRSYANISLEIAPVPEPETYAMMLAGLVITGVSARRRLKR